MKAVFDHIERVKGKPHHVRRKVAFGTAFGVTASIALLWFGFTLSAGTFALQGTTFAESTGAAPAKPTPGDSSLLAGAAAAFPKKEEPRIEIVDVTKPAPSEPEATILPF